MPPRSLRIGQGLALPVDAVTSTLIVYGGKGMGKTNLLAVTLEEMSKAGLRWCSIDPIGVHWGLKHAADGKGDGIPVLILGGIHGDLPITPGSGEIVADLVADEGVNVIVDCSRDAEGKMWSIGERIRFITAFALRLFQRQGSLIDGQRREPIFLALDEAARYVPQNPRAGDKDIAFSLGAWEQLVEEGRNVGIGVGLFTQRSARLNKSVAELADAMFAFRTTGPNSIDAIIDWLGEHVPKADQRAMIEQVRRLPVGSALIVSPGWLDYEGVVPMRARETFDSSATPKPGERARRVTGSGATVDLDAYRTRMAEVVEEAEASNPRALRAQLAAAQRDLGAAEHRLELARAALLDRDYFTEGQVGLDVAPRIIELDNARCQEIGRLTAELAERPEPVGLSDDAVAAMQRIDAALAEVGERIERERKYVTEALVQSGEAKVKHARSKVAQRATKDAQPASRDAERAADVPHRVAHEAPRRPTPSRSAAPVAHRVAQRGTPGAEPDSSLSGSPRSILIVLAEAGGAALSDRVIAARAGVSRRKSTFRNAMSTLRGKGYIEGSNTSPSITQAGLDALGDYEALPSGRALVEHWLREVGRESSEGRLLLALLDNYPDWVHHADLSEMTGIDRTKSTYRNAMSRLKSLDLVTADRLQATVNEEIGRAWSQ